MKVKMAREDLVKAVGRTLGVVDRRGTMPILSHFLLQAGESHIMVAATDLEVSFRGFYTAEVEEMGAVALPANYFFNLIKDMPGETLELTGTEQSRLQIQVGESRYQLLGLPGEQFPPIPEIEGGMMVALESTLLREMIDKTSFSVSGDDLQYHLSGIFWERLETDGLYHLRLVSTDGHRLTLIQRPFPESENFPLDEGIIVPRKGVVEITRLLSEEEKVHLALTRKSLALKADDKYLFIRLLEKKFPDYRRIIPARFAFRFALNRKELLEVVRRISLLSTERFKGVVFNLGADMLEATFSNPEVGEGREVMPLTLEDGEESGLPLRVAFNARYLMEPLNAMESAVVLLGINDPETPCKLWEKGDEDYFAIIMPWSL